MKTKQLVLLIFVVVGLAYPGSTNLLGQTPGENQNSQTKQAESKPEANKPKEFRFDGGSVRDFVESIKRQFGIDLFELATISEGMMRVQVPKIRFQTADFRQLLNSYNQLSSEGIRSLGHWIVKSGKDGVPNAIVLVSPAQTNPPAEQKITIRAFSLRGITGKELDLLMGTIQDETQMIIMAMEEGRFGSVSLDQAAGNIRYHSDSEILVAKGGGTYVDLVNGLVEAFRERAKVNAPAAQGKQKSAE